MSTSTTTIDDLFPDELFSPADGHGDHDPEANVAFGFWAYLMSDCLLFATLFATFVVFSGSFAGGPTGRQLFDLGGTLKETMLLLTSSITCGFAILGMQRQARRQVMGWLAVTFLLGLGFVAMEVSEFAHMVAIGAGPDRSAFLSGFFTLVATHGLHVTAGLVWMLVMMGQVSFKGLSEPVCSRLRRFSMFWHFLDIVWIGVFTVVYLKGSL
jgi:cytochrome o ubiquinol oxidase subunit 3